MKIRNFGWVVAISVVSLTRLFAQEPSPETRPAPKILIPAPHREIKEATGPVVETAPRASERDLSKREETNQSLESIAKKEWAERPRSSEETETSRVGVAQQKQAATSSSYLEAIKRMQRGRHDRAWWSQRYQRIALAGAGYYYLDGSYWYPAPGFDPGNETYSYDGPIYSYDGLAPDQVIANVQTLLQESGYYLGAVSGVFDPQTRAAVANFQRDHELALTSAVDEATVKALGLA